MKVFESNCFGRSFLCFRRSQIVCMQNTLKCCIDHVCCCWINLDLSLVFWCTSIQKTLCKQGWWLFGNSLLGRIHLTCLWVPTDLEYSVNGMSGTASLCRCTSSAASCRHQGVQHDCDESPAKGGLLLCSAFSSLTCSTQHFSHFNLPSKKGQANTGRPLNGHGHPASWTWANSPQTLGNISAWLGE